MAVSLGKQRGMRDQRRIEELRGVVENWNGSWGWVKDRSKCKLKTSTQSKGHREHVE